MNIGKVMKDIREERGISRPAMAKDLGVTASALWKIENGKVVPKYGTIEKFSKSLNVPIARIYIESLDAADFFV